LIRLRRASIAVSDSVRKGLFVKRRSGMMIGIAATAVIGVAIAVLTLAPLQALMMLVPTGFDRLDHLLISIALNVPTGSDKLGHLLVFAGLTVPLAIVNPRLVLPLVPAAIAYGGLIEIIQPLVGRNAEWADFGANIAGALAGAGLGVVISRGRPGRNTGEEAVIPARS
jgi:hypothetical protein